MDEAREDLIERLFGEALALAPDERAPFLEEACGGDAALRSELAALLANEAGARDFFDRVAGDSAIRWAHHALADPWLATDDVTDTAGRAAARSVVRHRTDQPRRRFVRVGAAAVLFVLVVTMAVFAVSRRTSSADDAIASVAVFSVTDLAPDSATRGIADDMIDLLIDRLSRVRELRAVTPRTSVMRYAGTRKSAREIGEELGVDGLVEVSVFRDDERARVTVDLILVDTEQVMWSRHFEGAMREVPALGREVAEVVALEVRRRATR